MRSDPNHGYFEGHYEDHVIAPVAPGAVSDTIQAEPSGAPK